MAGFADLLKSQKSSKLPATEANTVRSTEEKEQRAKQLKKNVIAMANSTMAFKTGSHMSMIYKSQSNDWHTGETLLEN